MGRKQKGGNFKGKKYQRSTKQKGGNIIKKIKNHKVSRTLQKHLVNVGRELGGMFLNSSKGKQLKAKTKQPETLPVQSGSGIGRGKRHGPPKKMRNTIPSAKLVLYHQ
jgi:hypothetical protein